MLLLLVIASDVVANAQIITAEDVEKAIAQTYGVQPETGKDYMILADYLKEKHPLDMNNQLSFVSIIEAPGKAKDNKKTRDERFFCSFKNN